MRQHTPLRVRNAWKRHLWMTILLCSFGGAVACLRGSLAIGEARPPVNAAQQRSVGDQQLLQEQALARYALNHLIYRDRHQQLELHRGLEAFEKGRVGEGLENLQRIFDRGQDSLDWNETSTALVSLRAEAMKVLEGLSRREIRNYEQVYGAEASRLLQDGIALNEAGLVEDVVRRFFYTQAGFEAVDWLANRWLDRGRFAMAARGWESLFEARVHRSRMTRAQLLKLVVASEMSDRHEHLAEIQNLLEEHNVTIGNRSMSATDWLSRFQRDVLSRTRPEDLDIAESAARRNITISASTAYLDPVWSVPLSRNGEVIPEVDEWEEEEIDEALKSSATACHPLVVGQAVVFRDYDGVRAVSLKDGHELWKYTSTLDLKGFLDRLSLQRKSTSLTTVEQAYVGNSALGVLATDGVRVFAIEMQDSPTTEARAAIVTPPVVANPARGRRNASRVQSPEESQITSRLIALRLDNPAGKQAESIKPEWSVGGAGQAEGVTGGGGSVLADHQFLGSPLVVDGVLYVITEVDRQMNLVALRARTGEHLWTQGIALLEERIQDKTQHDRYAAACSPTFSEGIVVCPTELGIVVGVDSLTGGIRWVYHYGQEFISSSRTVFARSRRRMARFGHPGLTNWAMIQGRKCLYLPRYSQKIHCIDLVTGEADWTVPREDAEYIAAVSDEVVLVVGTQQTRGLLLQDEGRELWATRIGVPSGRGLRTGESYLVPLKSGQLAHLKIADGKAEGFSTPQWHERTGKSTSPQPFLSANALPGSGASLPGNLAAQQDMIVSMGGQSIAAFPQAAPLLKKVNIQLAADPSDDEQRLLAARLELLTGDVRAAEVQVKKLLGRKEETVVSDRAAGLMRELLYINLDSSQPDRFRSFSELDRLATTSSQRSRYLMHKTEWQLERGDWSGVLASVGEFARLDLEMPVSVADDSSFRVSAAAWVPAILRRLEDLGGERARSDIETLVLSERKVALSNDDLVGMRRFLDVYGRRPEAGIVRLRLAQRHFDRGDYQAAELLLLEGRHDRDLNAQVFATEKLAQLWDHLGLHTEAAGLLAELNQPHEDDSQAVRRERARFLAEFPRQSLSWSMYEQTQPLDWAVDRVAVQEHRWFESDPQLHESYTGYRQRFVTPAKGAFHVLDKGSTRESRFAIVDRETGMTVGTVRVPSDHNYPIWAKDPLLGHLIPLGGKGSIAGLSLIEHETNEPLWTRDFETLSGRGKTILSGPAGDGFCVFQANQYLFAVAPHSGQILWLRSDLDPESGLQASRSTGLFGDAESLVVFGSDRASYTVYRTLTGEVLRRGKLDVSLRDQVRSFGRKLLHVTDSLTQMKRIRLWDPTTDRVEIDEPFHSGHVYVDDSHDELAVMHRDGQLRIFDIKTSQVRLDVQMDPQDIAGLQLLQFFSDSERYYINIRRPRGRSRQMVNISYGSDRFVPTADIQGDLFAIDRKTGRSLWERTFPQRSVFDLSEYHLPFLVMLSRVRDYATSRESSYLEIVDVKTGNTLGVKENILNDRIVNVWYERQKGLLQLFGVRSRIDVEFDRERQQVPQGDEVL